MGVFFEIAWGSGLLVFCLAIHIAVSARLVVYLHHNRPLAQSPSIGVFIRTLSIVLVVFLLSHTVQIYLWAVLLWWQGALPGYEEALYFTLVTYATLGYGDIVLDPGFRIFAAMASVCGILMFGLTTAFMVSFMARFLDLPGRN